MNELGSVVNLASQKYKTIKLISNFNGLTNFTVQKNPLIELMIMNLEALYNNKAYAQADSPFKQCFMLSCSALTGNTIQHT